LNLLDTYRGAKPYIVVAVAIALTYGIFIYLQSLHEDNISNRLIQDHQTRQELLSQSITQNIGSNLDGSLQRIKALAFIVDLDGQTSGTILQNQMRIVFSDIRNIAPFDELFIVYQNVTGFKLTAEGNASESFVVAPLNFTSKNFGDFINKSLNAGKIQYSPGYNSDGKWKIAITAPIFDLDTGKYQGLIGISIPSLDLVQRFGNVLDPTKLRLVFYDSNATLLAGYPLPNSIIGKSMFSPENQKIISQNGRPLVNQLFQMVLAGQKYTSVFDLGDGKRIVSGSPIYVEGQPVYYLNIPTPFSEILLPVQDLLHSELILNIVILIAFTAAMSYLLFTMSQWGTKMEREVKKRTANMEISNKILSQKAVEMQMLNTDLDRANKKLRRAYEELKVNDTLQREFVNIAAHEFRTPVQSIIGYLHLMDLYPENSTSYLERIKSNSQRLERLTQDILDVARIESGTFHISRERFDLKELISRVTSDLDLELGNRKNDFKIVYDKGMENLIVNADKSRITQVISNLISNANKFTQKGEIIISVRRCNDKKQTEFKIIDNGRGIDKDVLPRLFEKFVSKSDTSGTGIGLYISKQIIKAHGGKIYGKNNENGRGAEFGFRLPDD
jgi:signal transduction histidine kinase